MLQPKTVMSIISIKKINKENLIPINKQLLPTSPFLQLLATTNMLSVTNLPIVDISHKWNCVTYDLL